MLRAFESIKIFNVDRETVQTVLEGLVMLQGQDGGGYQHGYLFAVSSSLEGGTNGHLGLSETHVAADESIHRALAFHVAFYIVGGLELVRGVFIDEGCFELGLQVAVGGKLEALAALAFGVKLDQLTSNVLDFTLCLGFQSVPCVGTKGAQRRLGAVLGAVFGDLVERVDTDVKRVAMVVSNAQHLLFLAVQLDGHQSLETPDAVVDMGDIVSRLEVVEVLQGYGLLGAKVVAQVVAVVTLKDLVVGVAAHLVVMVDEARMDGNELSLEVAVQLIVMLDVVQDGLDTVQLLGTLRIKDDLVALRLVIVEILNEEVEVFIEDGLGSGMVS